MALAEHHEHRHDLAAKEVIPSPEQSRDPVCGMAVDPKAAKYRAEHRGVTYFFCSAKCHEKFIAEPNKYLRSNKSVSKSPDPERCHLHLPDASADSADGARELSDLRDDAGAGRSPAKRTGPSPELIKHDAPLLDRCGARGAARGPGNGRAFSGLEPSPLRFAAAFGVGAILARDAGRSVGWMAILRARLRRRYATGPSTCSASSRWASVPPISTALPPPLRPSSSRRACGRKAESSPSITRQRPSSRCSSCSGRFWNCGRASRPGAPSALC